MHPDLLQASDYKSHFLQTIEYKQQINGIKRCKAQAHVNKLSLCNKWNFMTIEADIKFE